MFSAVLLASRLSTNLSVFALMLLAVELFAFLPVVRWRVCYHFRRTGHLLLTILIVGCATAILAAGLTLRSPMSEDRHERGRVTLLVVYMAVVVFITLVCPRWLKSVQKHKLKIQGPWDIAHIMEDHPGFIGTTCGHHRKKGGFVAS